MRTAESVSKFIHRLYEFFVMMIIPSRFSFQIPRHRIFFPERKL